MLIISGYSMPAEVLGPLGGKALPPEHMGTEQGFSFPPNLFLIYYAPAQQGGMPALQGLRYLGCAVNEAIMLIKRQPGTLSQRGPSLSPSAVTDTSLNRQTRESPQDLLFGIKINSS